MVTDKLQNNPFLYDAKNVFDDLIFFEMWQCEQMFWGLLGILGKVQGF